MKATKITCDRCGATVDGFEDTLPVPGVPQKYTAGFYDVSGGYWAKFARGGEKKVCDACMHADPDYQAIYRTS